MMDISDTLAPNSDQLDAIDLLTGPRTFTVEKVSKGNADQPVNIHLVEFPRPWRPSKSMRRVLVACWGADAATYVGRRLKLWCDPKVVFGGAEVGGTRILALSDIDKPRTVSLLVTRGRSAPYRVDPLPPEQTPERTKPGEHGYDAAHEKLSEAQGRKLWASLKERKLTERADVLAYCSAITGREVASTKDLTVLEASNVIDALAGGVVVGEPVAS